MKKILILFLLIGLMLSIQAAPKWFETARTLGNSGEIIVGIGSGSNRDQALSNAKTDLLQQISVKVQSTTDIQAKSIESEGKEYYSESIQKATKLTVDQSIKGMKVDNEESQKGTWYVMVSISKANMLSVLKSELNQLTVSIRTLISDAENFVDQGKVSLAIKNYTDAQALIPELLSKKAMYDSFADTPYSIANDVNVKVIDSNIRQLIASIRIDLVSGNQQNAKKGTQLPEPLVFKVSIRDPQTGNTTALSGMPVKAVHSDGQMIEKGLTNNEGEYSFNVLAVPSQGDRGKVMLKLDSINLPSYFNSYINTVAGEAFFKTSEGSSVVVQVKVTDSKNTRQEKSERRLTKVLNDNNIQVNTISPLMMAGTLSVKDTKMVEGVGSPQHIAVVDMDIQLMIIKTKEVLGTITASGKGMSSKSEKEAIEKAYDNISINARELKQMISTSEAKIQEALDRAQAYEPVVVEKIVEKPVYIEKEVEKQVIVEKPVIVEKEVEKTVYVEKESPQEPRRSSGEKDDHWFTDQDYLYAQKPFTNESREMLTRVGKLTTPASKETKNQAKLFDHDKGIDVWTEYYYMTTPAQINNINEGDIVFVFHNGKKPQDERQAKTDSWKMCRVTNTDELFKESVALSAYPWTANLAAIRVIAKAPVYKEKPSTQNTSKPQGKDAHGLSSADVFYCDRAFTNDSEYEWVKVGEIVNLPSSSTKNEAEIFSHAEGKNVWSQYFWHSEIATKDNIKRGAVVLVYSSRSKPEDAATAKKGDWVICRVNSLDGLYKGTISVTGFGDVDFDAVRIVTK